jgi:hypothetical protein
MFVPPAQRLSWEVSVDLRWIRLVGKIKAVHTTTHPATSRTRRIAICIVLVTVLAATGFGVAAAEVGVSISPGELAVAESTRPGRQTTLPPLQVGNPGDQPASYEVVAVGLTGTSAQPAEPDWFTLIPRTLQLAPGQTAEVTVMVQPGAEAATGRYAATIQAQLQPPGSATQIVAAAAARVFFDITAEPQDTDNTTRVWVLIALLIAVAVVTAEALRRRRTSRVAQRSTT